MNEKERAKSRGLAPGGLDRKEERLLMLIDPRQKAESEVQEVRALEARSRCKARGRLGESLRAGLRVPPHVRRLVPSECLIKIKTSWTARERHLTPNTDNGHLPHIFASGTPRPLVLEH